jgi:hypothetical protein
MSSTAAGRDAGVRRDTGILGEAVPAAQGATPGLTHPPVRRMPMAGDR